MNVFSAIETSETKFKHEISILCVFEVWLLFLNNFGLVGIILHQVVLMLHETDRIAAKSGFIASINTLYCDCCCSIKDICCWKRVGEVT